MAWVPLVGSGLGSLIGGLLSDFFIRKLLAARGHVEDDSNGDGLSGKLSFMYVCMYVCMSSCALIYV